MSGFNPKAYGKVFAVRKARVFDAGCFLMRFYFCMLNMGTLTMMTLSGYTFLAAGVTSSVIAFSVFFLSPQIAKLVDRMGQHKVVPYAGMVSVAGLVAMVAGVLLHAPEWAFLLAAVPLGCIPNPQALARSRWTYLVRTGKLGAATPDIQTVFAYEGVLDDCGFMLSPAVSIALASAIAPVAGMVAGGIAFAAGFCLVTLSRSTEPEPGWTDGDAEAAVDRRPDGEKRKSVIRTSPVVRVLFVTMFCIGAVFGIMDTSTVALAEDAGDPNIAGLVLMVGSLVSVACGIVFGMFHLKAKPYVLMAVTSVLLGCAYGTIFLIDSPLSLFVISTVAALTYAPFVITNNYVCERAVPSSRLTEGITWMNEASTCGMAFGPSIAGFIVDCLGASAAFDLGAVFAVAIPVVVLAFGRSFKREIKEDSD